MTFIPISRHRTVRRGPNEKLHITAKLYQLQGNSRPYFSVTADLEDRKYGRAAENYIVGGGCMHEDILRHAPEYAPAVALHLSDENGVPMHALDNAWYWAGGVVPYRREGKPGEPAVPNAPYLASHLRISLADAEKIITDVWEGRTSKAGLAAMVEAMKPRWKAEALAVIQWMQEVTA